ncbi:serine/threonine-protein kinase HipA [Pelomonas aquatica]|uniref:Serine/threonine-protein kinase HipA n=1 Tax=Pelomonas aquatica TaxID=431058 RepID=A0ABU1ZA35_9BURK|nr:serine/threonine-protein kinase HipA [Pelomonas aquatica]
MSAPAGPPRPPGGAHPVNAPYVPSATLFLWWLGQPAQPRWVGTLAMVQASKGVSLRYAPSWLRHGFALSEDLPLLDQEWLPEQREAVAGAVDDARPDRWGERVIRFIDKPPRLALLDYLFFAGDERFGALGVSTSPDVYMPRSFGPLPALGDLATIDELVRQVQAGQPVQPALQRLIAPGATLGGARPKALISLDGHPWVLKFSELGEALDMPLIEHATMTLAAKAGITPAETRPLPLPGGRHAVAVRRFDRAPGQRVHALSAFVALRAAGEAMGYPELAQLLRRRGALAEGRSTADRRELFRRMVFNILIDNTDDHEKNHALLMNDAGDYLLSPAFDVLPSGQALGYQQMRVGRDMADSTLANAMSEAAAFGLKAKEAAAEARRVAAVVDGWQAHFRAAGVRAGDVALLAEQIDREHLRQQRQVAA